MTQPNVTDDRIGGLIARLNQKADEYSDTDSSLYPLLNEAAVTIMALENLLRAPKQ